MHFVVVFLFRVRRFEWENTSLAFEGYLDSSYQGSVPQMAPSRVTGGFTQSSASSGILFQGDGQSQNIYNPLLSSSFGNSANSIPGTGRLNFGPVSGEINQIVLNSVANSANSIGASSLVTDANSAFSGGPQLQRSASFNTDSYMRLPASPMSFTSNNLSVSGSSIVDGQQNPHHDPNSQHVNQNQNQQHLQQGASSVTSLPSSQSGQIPMSMATRFPNSFTQDPASLSRVQKKPRLDFKQDDIVQQQVMQQLLQRDPMQLQNHNPQLQAYIQQQRLRQQQQIIQAMPQMQRAQLQQHQQQQQQQQHQQHQQLQLRQQMQQQNMQQMALMKNPHETGGICARRLMQYLFHRRKPAENTISYWRSFVKEYYAPRAKKRWCLSLYENVVHHAFGVFPQSTMDAWHCDICGSKSGRGFEATYEVLPRLNEIKFSSGMVDELLYLDMPRERRSISGIMMLEYGKAVQESVYDQVRIIREGHLRIIFSQDLKILSWEFCARRHEELLPRRIVASQVNQFLQVAQKCQSTIDESGSEGLSSQELQSNGNMVASAGRQLAKSLELQSLNDLGFSKRYVRCLQIAEVVNSMKDLMDFTRDSKVGPIEGLKNYSQNSSSTSKLQLQKMQEMDQLGSMQPGLPTDGNNNNKLMPNQAAVNNHMLSNNNNNNPPAMSGRAALSGPAAAALALTNYHSMLRQQTPINPHPQEPSSLSLNNPRAIPSPSSSFQGPTGLHSSPQQAHNQQQQQQHPPQTSQALQQQMIQQLLHNMSNNNGAGGHPGQPMGSTPRGPPQTGPNAGGGPGPGPMLSKCGSPKAAVSGVGDVSQSMHLADEMVQELTNGFTDNGFYSSSSLDDTLEYGWKA
ncbi:hypothetical protein V2J09_001792 [Rumex salicifolius]